MSAFPPVFIYVAIEGPSDEAVVRKLCDHLDIAVTAVHGRRGKQWLDRNLARYNRAAQYLDWLVVRDLDNDAPCAPALVHRLLPEVAPLMTMRIAVRQVEAWLIADHDRLASYLGVSRQAMPRSVEGLASPKREMIRLAASSRRREVRDDMIPRTGSGATEGPAYVSRLIEFAASWWRPEHAARNCASLSGAIRALTMRRSRGATRGAG